MTTTQQHCTHTKTSSKPGTPRDAPSITRYFTEKRARGFLDRRGRDAGPRVPAPSRPAAGGSPGAPRSTGWSPRGEANGGCLTYLVVLDGRVPQPAQPFADFAGERNILRSQQPDIPLAICQGLRQSLPRSVRIQHQQRFHVAGPLVAVRAMAPQRVVVEVPGSGVGLADFAAQRGPAGINPTGPLCSLLLLINADASRGRTVCRRV
jgi:hypothetical protein